MMFTKYIVVDDERTITQAESVKELKRVSKLCSVSTVGPAVRPATGRRNLGKANDAMNE